MQSLCYKSTLEDLDFADRIALLSDSSTNMQIKTKRLSSITSKMGLISYDDLHPKKTKNQPSENPSNSQLRHYITGKGGEEVGQYTYLGRNMQANEHVQKEIMSLAGLVAASFTSINKIWSSEIYYVKTKLLNLNSNIAT